MSSNSDREAGTLFTIISALVALSALVGLGCLIGKIMASGLP